MVDPAREAVADFVRAARSTNTARGYDGAMRRFTQWCADQPTRPVALPATPATVGCYVIYLSTTRGLQPGSVQSALNGINSAHRLAGHAAPGRDDLVCMARNTAARAFGGPSQGRAPILPAQFVALHARIPPVADPRLAFEDIRNYAMVLLMALCGLRGADAVALRVGDVTVSEDQRLVYVHVACSKTDRKAEGAWRVAQAVPSCVAMCPVAQVRALMEATPARSVTRFSPFFAKVRRWPRLRADGPRTSDEASRVRGCSGGR